MTVAIESLKLDRLFIIYPGDHIWHINNKITVCPPLATKKLL